jgi:hypothetical protein
MMYEGVQPSKSKKAIVKDTCGMLAGYSECDQKLASLSGNVGAFRMSESRAFFEAMMQEMARNIFYGNARADARKFTGFAPRYNDLGAPNAENVIDAGGTGPNLTSIWLVLWGEDSCFGIVPKGSKVGLSHKDHGEVQLIDENGGKYPGYSDYYSWDGGLVVKDWRSIVRIANIDIDALWDCKIIN